MAAAAAPRDNDDRTKVVYDQQPVEGQSNIDAK